MNKRCCCNQPGNCCNCEVCGGAVYITWMFQFGGHGEEKVTGTNTDCPCDSIHTESATATGYSSPGACSGFCKTCPRAKCVGDNPPRPRDYSHRYRLASGVNIPGVTLRCACQEVSYSDVQLYWCVENEEEVVADTSLQYTARRWTCDYSPGTVYMNYFTPNGGAEGGCCAIAYDWSTYQDPAADKVVACVPVIKFTARAKYQDYCVAYRMARTGNARRAVVELGYFRILDENDDVIHEWLLADYTLEELRVEIDAVSDLICEAAYGGDQFTHDLPAAWFVDQDVAIPVDNANNVPPPRVAIKFGTMTLGTKTEFKQPGAGAQWNVTDNLNGYLMMPVQPVDGVIDFHPLWVGPTDPAAAEDCFCRGFCGQVLGPSQTLPGDWWATNSPSYLQGGILGQWPNINCLERDTDCNVIGPQSGCDPDVPSWGIYGFWVNCGPAGTFTYGEGLRFESVDQECGDSCAPVQNGYDPVCTRVEREATSSVHVSGFWMLQRTCADQEDFQ